MAKKQNTIPSGFDDILGNIYSNSEQGEGVTDMNALMQPNIPLDDEDDKNEPPVNKNPEDGTNEDPKNTEDPNAHEDNTPEPPANVNDPEPPVDNNPPAEPPVDNGEPSEADVIEAQQVGLFFDALGASLGWNMDDIDEKDRPLTVD